MHLTVDRAELMARFPRLHRWGGRLLTLFIGQGVVQVMNLVIGFLLVRWMSMDAYAQFGVVFGFQSSLGILVDLGFSGCIVSLVGNRGDRPEVIGGYIAAARWIRFRLFLVMIPLSAIVFFWIGAKHHWDLGDQILLFVCVAISLYSQGRVSWYSAPLLIHQRIGQIYRVQSAVACARLVGTLLLKLTGALSAVTLTIVNTFGLIWTASRYHRQARSYLSVPGEVDHLVRKEMLRYLSPLIPGLVFLALQGQLSVMLISIFGKTQSIAEVAALGRLGQLFVLLSAINSTIIEPYFARLDSSLLLSRYVLFVGVSLIIAGGMSGLAFLFPAPLLWILGHKYEHLDQELGWMIASSSLGYVGGVMWTIHSARRWIFWWGTFLYIGLLTFIQVVFIVCTNLSTALSVIYLGFVTNVAILFIHSLTALIGFYTEARRNETALVV